MKFLNDFGWHKIVDNYDSYPRGMKRVFPFLLASLVYHIDWMKNTFDSAHPIWASRILSAMVIKESEVPQRLVDYLRDKVLPGCGMCPVAKMHATGIPPHLAISNELAELRQEVLNLKLCINEQGRRQEEVVGQFYSKIEVLFGGLAGDIVDVILDRVEVTGAQQVRKSDIVELISRNNAIIISEMRGLLNSRRDSVESASSGDVRPVEAPVGAVFNTNFQWRGELGGRWLPEDFIFPSYPTKQLWNMWHHGWAAKGIIPFKRIGMSNRHRDLRTKMNKTGFSRCRRVMEEMERIALKKQFILPNTDVSSLSCRDSDLLFERAFNVLVEELYPGKQKENRCEVVINTINNELVRRDGTHRLRRSNN